MLKNIKDKLENLFHKIFSNSHLIYTLIFFLFILLITLFSFTSNPLMGNIALFIAVTSALTFIIMMIFSLYPKLDETFFLSDKIFEKRKIFIFLLIYLISSIIIIIYFSVGSSNQLPIQFLGWDLALPVFFIVIYFGWNIFQIVFIKTGFDEISTSIDKKLMTSNRTSTKAKSLSWLFLVLAIIVPVLMQIVTFIGFVSYFQPQNSGDPQDPLYWYIGWNIVMFFIIVLLSFHLIYLFIQSKKKTAPNLFSSIFYLLIWIIIWFRSFSFINNFRTVASSIGADLFRNFMDILLLIITAIIVLRGLGDKVYKYKIFTPNNLPFFLFSFAILYIEGQVIMITGAGSIASVYDNFKQVSLANNFIVLVVTVIYYWWYAKYSLEQKNFIFKNRFKAREVYAIIKDFGNYLEVRNLIEKDRLSEREIKSFLKDKKIAILDDDEEQNVISKKESQDRDKDSIGVKSWDLDIE